MFDKILFIIIGLIIIQRYTETFAQRSKKQGSVKHRWTIVLLFIFHNMLLFGTVGEYFILHRNLNIIIIFFGLSLYFLGLLLRNWAIKTLGEYWSIHIEIRENHPVVKTGPYKYLRHPAYLAIIFEVLGFPLIMNSYYTFLFALFCYLPLLLLREYFEEIEMIKGIGNGYLEYRKKTWAFLNFLYFC